MKKNRKVMIFNLSKPSIAAGLLLAALAIPAFAADDVAATSDIKAPASIGGADYHLAPRDMVVFQIYNELDMQSAQRLTATGTIRLPLIGTVQLAGLSLREAEQLLQSMYIKGGYFIQPQVLLSVQQYDDRFVAVLGQVKNPDRMPFPVETTALGILQAITQSGGFTRIARTDAVQVNRVSSEGRDERIVVNVEQFLAAKDSPAHEFQLLPGDVVFVPERVF